MNGLTVDRLPESGTFIICKGVEERFPKGGIKVSLVIGGRGRGTAAASVMAAMAAASARVRR